MPVYCIWKPKQAPYIALKVGVLSFVYTPFIPGKIKTAENQMTNSRFLYPERDLNPHSHYWPKDFKSFVSTISPSGRPCSVSGKRDSNSRPRPWQGRALPTELLPQILKNGCKDRKFPVVAQLFPCKSWGNRSFGFTGLFVSDPTRLALPSPSARSGSRPSFLASGS